MLYLRILSFSMSKPGALASYLGSVLVWPVTWIQCIIPTYITLMYVFFPRCKHSPVPQYAIFNMKTKIKTTWTTWTWIIPCIKLYEDDLGGGEQTLRPLALSITVGSSIPIHYQRKCQWMACRCRFSDQTWFTWAHCAPFSPQKCSIEIQGFRLAICAQLIPCIFTCHWL